MTDTFLDDHTTTNLLRDLRGIARNPTDQEGK